MQLRRSMYMLALLALGGCDRLFAVLEVEHLQDAALALDDSQVDSDAPTDVPLVDAMPDSSGGNPVPDARPIDAPGPVCPSNYTNARGASTYLHVTTATTWLAAQQVCISHQISGSTKYTHLAVVSDDPERSYMYATVIGSDAQSHWIGYSDRVTESVYKWVSTETGYPSNGDMPWGSGQPGTGNGENCAVMSSLIDFVAADCTLKTYHYVCECDDYPNNAANY